LSSAAAGEIVALGRLDDCATGDTLSDGNAEAMACAAQLPPVYSLAITAAKRDDEVKMSTALSKLKDEDPGLIVDHDADLGELLLRGQGDIHLKLNVERMKSKYALEVTSTRPSIPYREAITKSIQQHGRHKKQSGGHGQFGDVHLEIKPLPRGSGFEFVDKIVGGAVPKTYIPAVRAGVVEYLNRGPLGFHVVDVQVTLYDGQFHAVDSSEIAFRTAGQIAMREGMPNCGSVLLEPILQVNVTVPSEYTPKVNGMVSSRRGQILGFEMREGWQGWDVTSAHIPQSEMHDFIIELRSVTQGVGTFTSSFDHLQQLSGRGADEVINARSSDKAA
jgi:elongation factor G